MIRSIYKRCSRIIPDQLERKEKKLLTTASTAPHIISVIFFSLPSGPFILVTTDRLLNVLGSSTWHSFSGYRQGHSFLEHHLRRWKETSTETALLRQSLWSKPPIGSLDLLVGQQSTVFGIPRLRWLSIALLRVEVALTNQPLMQVKAELASRKTEACGDIRFNDAA